MPRVKKPREIVHSNYPEIQLSEKTIEAIENRYSPHMAGNGRSALFIGWHPLPEDEFVTCDGNIFVIRFDKLFNSPNLMSYNKFIIKKNSYVNQLEEICRYFNFFSSIYDREHELLSAYLKLTYEVDKEKLYNADNIQEFISAIYEFLFTPSIIAKIKLMVEENYIDDIERGNDGNAKYIKDGVKHLESLEFTNEHIKAQLMISHSMKLMAPLMFHYFYLNEIRPDDTNQYIFKFYQPLYRLGMFSDTVDIYNKTYVYVKAKVLENKGHNAVIYQSREIHGADESTIIDRFTKVVIISDNSFKYKFPEKWDAKQGKFEENILGFMKTIIKYQSLYFLKKQFKVTFTEINGIKNNDGLSGMDKYQMNQPKRDEV